MQFTGDVDSADNEEETDSELQERTQNGYDQDDTTNGRCFAYENGEAIDMPNSELNAFETPMGSLGCYLSNSYNVLRPNQLLRAKVKHETKL